MASCRWAQIKTLMAAEFVEGLADFHEEVFKMSKEKRRVSPKPAAPASKFPDVDRKEAERLLMTARVLQTAFWDALRELEFCLTVEVDGNMDLEDQTVASLLEDGIPMYGAGEDTD